MIMMIIVRFGLLLVVFYHDFPFPYWKENYFYSFIVLATPPLKASRPPWGTDPQVGKPWWCSCMLVHVCEMFVITNMHNIHWNHFLTFLFFYYEFESGNNLNEIIFLLMPDLLTPIYHIIYMWMPWSHWSHILVIKEVCNRCRVLHTTESS